jgi:hypothetical protein
VLLQLEDVLAASVSSWARARLAAVAASRFLQVARLVAVMVAVSLSRREAAPQETAATCLSPAVLP